LIGQRLQEEIEGRTLGDEVVGAVVGEAETADRLSHKPGDAVSAIDRGLEEPEVAEWTRDDRHRLRLALGLTPTGQPLVRRSEIVGTEVRGQRGQRGIAVIHRILAEAEGADEFAAEERALENSTLGLDDRLHAGATAAGVWAGSKAYRGNVPDHRTGRGAPDIRNARAFREIARGVFNAATDSIADIVLLVDSGVVAGAIV